MDANLSKSLLMAGGIMISVMVISIMLNAYTEAQTFAEANEAAMAASQVESFNRFYTSYMDSYSGTTTIRCVDAVNILNRAYEDGVEISVTSAYITSPNGYYEADSKDYVTQLVQYKPTFDNDTGIVTKVTIN